MPPMAKRKAKPESLLPDPAFDAAIKKWNEEWEKAIREMFKDCDLLKAAFPLPSFEPWPSESFSLAFPDLSKLL
jgi:hypothetical protein